MDGACNLKAGSGAGLWGRAPPAELSAGSEGGVSHRQDPEGLHQSDIPGETCLSQPKRHWHQLGNCLPHQGDCFFLNMPQASVPVVM